MQKTPLTPTALRRRDGVLATLVSAGFVAIGVGLRDQVSWYATAFFAVCMVVGLLSLIFPSIFPDPTASYGRLAIDDVGITRTGRRLREHVAWADIVRVGIMTNDQGPHLDDVFFVLEGKNGEGCVVPHDLAVRAGLLEALQSRLEGVDNAAVIEAMTSTENRVFIIWQDVPK